ncbi:expressed unknown protein [Seminavis robusta]|uniref:Uncharacterized protein n=1 Tax=Seminavis robusta TaxID=568900 RepID=A0A9N8E335_9STRA|nr:expressed unknown protein [Seminavis robusta]|eukprot:Sro600_g173341.1  (147) ;mRNA; r:10055-10495
MRNGLHWKLLAAMDYHYSAPYEFQQSHSYGNGLSTKPLECTTSNGTRKWSSCNIPQADFNLQLGLVMGKHLEYSTHSGPSMFHRKPTEYYSSLRANSKPVVCILVLPTADTSNRCHAVVPHRTSSSCFPASWESKGMNRPLASILT